MTCIRLRDPRRLRACRNSNATAALLTAASLVTVVPAHGAPSEGVITAGAGSIIQQGSTTTVTQSAAPGPQAARMVIDWKSFSSAAGESIVFKQPNAAAIALNRVTGASPSQLMGSLGANGQVFILNPNGVLFGPGSQVNVHGLLASTLNMDTAGFMAGSHVLQGSSSAKVVNQGSLTAADGGYVALIGPAVVNDGLVSATRGDAVLAAGDKITLRLEGGSLIGYRIDLGSVNALVDNTASATISANGGRVALEAQAASALSKAVVNHAGLIEARTLESDGGSIRLIGDPDTGQMQVSGTLDASAPNGGNGGFIETSAARVKIADSARVTTMAASGAHGTWLIDPLDFEIAPDNGARTDSSIGAATLLAAMDKSDVTITTSSTGNGAGDITVNADVVWQAPTRLTLEASRNIVFNATLRGQSVALRYGQASADGGDADYYFNNGARIDLSGANGTFSTRKGSNAANLKNYTIVRSLGTDGNTADPSTLQGVSSPDTGANYALGADIDATATTSWKNAAGIGFIPLAALNGTFEGLGHTINGLSIFRPESDVERTGLFSSVSATGEVRNLGLTQAAIRGTRTVGALAGLNEGTIRNSYVTGGVRGTLRTGGLAGVSTGAIVTSHSEADVEGVQVTGGLVGEIKAGSVSGSYASGTVFNTSPVADEILFTGGLVGFNRGRISGSYSSAAVSGNKGVGGLAGQNSASIEDSYATGSVAGQTWVGGLAGFQETGSSIKNTYATGSVRGAEAVTTGGLVGASASTATVANSYWNTETTGGTGQATSAGGEGRTAVQLRQAATFSGWDIADSGAAGKTWRIYEGNSMPLLRSFLAPLVLASSSNVYSGTAQINPAIFPSGTRTGRAASGRDVGTYLPYSDQQGYDISNGELVITPKPLDITALIAPKVYDGTNAATATLQVDSAGGDVLTAAYTLATFADKNAGLDKAVKVSDITLSGSAAANYTFNTAATATGTITARPLDIEAIAADKVYDSKPEASVTLLARPLDGDAVTPAYSTASFDNKNAGNGKQVTVSGIRLSGADALNYSYDPQVPTTASIAQRLIDIAATGMDKVYDGKTDASANLVAKPLGPDLVTASYAAASFDDKKVGTDKNVTVSGFTLTGADAANYVTPSQLMTKAAITPLQLNPAITNVDKVYDGNTTASATLTVKPLEGDVLSATYGVAEFDNKNAGTGKVMRISGITLTGADALNYSALPEARTTARITPRPLEITATGIDKVYDGKPDASATLIAKPLPGDLLQAAVAAAAFSDKNVGTNKAVTVTGFTLSGPDADNYAAPAQARTTASIAPRPLNIDATAVDKIYDGTTSALALLQDNRIAGDAITASYQRAEFADKNGGEQKIVTVSGIRVAGPDAANYLPDTSITARASIKPLSLTVTANPDARLADGVPYRGGNGVAYAGFLEGETAADLEGQLRYGGSAQGAIKEGSYRITPGGLASLNYAARFVDGTLTMQPLPPGAGIIAAYTAPAVAALPMPSGPHGRNGTGALRITDCGMRMPENVLLGGCEFAYQPTRVLP